MTRRMKEQQLSMGNIHNYDAGREKEPRQGDRKCERKER